MAAGRPIVGGRPGETMTRPLRIFLCCQQDLRLHPVPAYRFWADSFRSAFAEAGHACLEAPGCDWAEGLTPLGPEALAAWREATWQRAVDWIRLKHAVRPIDLFLSYLYPAQVHSGALAELRTLGIPTVNYFCDNVRLFRSAPAEYRGFDLHWVPEAAGLELYRRAGLPSIHAPMACWVAPKWRTPPSLESLPPTFVGTRDELRERLFARAFELGLKMDLRGVGWAGEAVPWGDPPPGRGLGLLANQRDFVARHGVVALARKIAHRYFPPMPLNCDFASRAKEPCLGDDYWRVLRECRVCVGVNRYPNPRRTLNRPDRYSRLRDIEAPMAGAAYLTETAPGLGELYDIGREIEVYADAGELAAKAIELERDEPRRRRLRELGQRRALRDHGIAQTISKVARRLGIS
jgi:hypothetical protein